MHAVGTLLAALSYASRARVAAPSAQSFFTSAIAFVFLLEWAMEVFGVILLGTPVVVICVALCRRLLDLPAS